MSETKKLDDELVRGLELIKQLDPAARQEWRAWAEWRVHDGNPATDPMRDNAGWQEWKRREREEAGHGA